MIKSDNVKEMNIKEKTNSIQSEEKELSESKKKQLKKLEYLLQCASAECGW